MVSPGRRLMKNPPWLGEMSSWAGKFPGTERKALVTSTSWGGRITSSWQISHGRPIWTVPLGPETWRSSSPRRSL